MGVDIDPNGTVNPARAGMIQRQPSDVADGDGKPRASGDDPADYATSAVDTK